MRINLIQFRILLILFFALGKTGFSQDTLSQHLILNKPFNLSFSEITNSDYIIDHSPTKNDSKIYNKYHKLISIEPNKKNYNNYYSLACALWNLNKLHEAKLMFLKIFNSKESFFEGTYFHSSDIPGDTSTSKYQYGSFTSNYKNYACRYLAKIYLEEHSFDQALKYIELADRTYTINYNCGTGHYWYQAEIRGIYGLCYEGLEKYDSIISMFLSQYYSNHNGILIRAIKKVYSQGEINSYLKEAENSIVCVVDTFQTSTYVIHNFGKKTSTTSELKYTSGTGTMMLFGKQIVLPSPELENGEIINKENFVNAFKESVFYIELMDKN